MGVACLQLCAELILGPSIKAVSLGEGANLAQEEGGRSVGGNFGWGAAWAS